jgi:hypothetical protein
MHTLSVTEMTTSTLSKYYRQKKKISTFARFKVRPRAQILIIPPASFADNHFTYVRELTFESRRRQVDEMSSSYWVYACFTWPGYATLYKYMVLRLFPLHCYVQTQSNTARWQLCDWVIRGRRLIEGKARIPAELCHISSGYWTRLPKWKRPECQDAPHGLEPSVDYGYLCSGLKSEFSVFQMPCHLGL